MAVQVKVSDTKTYDLSAIYEAQMVKGENQLLNAAIMTHKHTYRLTGTHTHTHTK